MNTLHRLSTLALSVAAAPALAHGDHGPVPGVAHMLVSGDEHLLALVVTVAAAVLAVRTAGVWRLVFGGLAAAGGAALLAL